MDRGITKLLSKTATIGFSVLGIAFIVLNQIIDVKYTLIFIPLLFLCFFALVIILFIANHRKRAHRREDMKGLARTLGWNYAEATELPLLRQFGANFGSSQMFKGTTQNFINGAVNGRPVAVFDQEYTTGSGENRSTYTQTVFLIEIREAQFPLFCLEPESFSDRLFDLLGKCDIDFPSHPHFSQKYQLYGRDENHIRYFFTPAILDFYEQTPLFTTVAGSRFLLIYEFNRLFNTGEIEPQINFLLYLADVFRRR